MSTMKLQSVAVIVAITIVSTMQCWATSTDNGAHVDHHEAATRLRRSASCNVNAWRWNMYLTTECDLPLSNASAVIPSTGQGQRLLLVQRGSRVEYIPVERDAVEYPRRGLMTTEAASTSLTDEPEYFIKGFRGSCRGTDRLLRKLKKFSSRKGFADGMFTGPKNRQAYRESSAKYRWTIKSTKPCTVNSLGHHECGNTQIISSLNDRPLELHVPLTRSESQPESDENTDKESMAFAQSPSEYTCNRFRMTITCPALV